LKSAYAEQVRLSPLAEVATECANHYHDLMEQRNTDTIPGIQALRGLAAILVLIHHVLEESQPLFDGHIPARPVLFGACGVDLFFVISGFIMYHVNRNRFVSNAAPRDFFVRRVIRIVPLYWLCTLVIVLLHGVGLYASKVITWGSVAASLLFVPTPDIVLGVGWTLNYEMYFYALFAIWLWLGTQRSGVIGILVSLLLVIGASHALQPGAIQYFLANPIALEFGYGVLLGVAFDRNWLPRRVFYWALPAGLAGLALGTWYGPSIGTMALTPDIRFVFWGVPAAFILMAVLAANSRFGRAGGVLVGLGNASYSLYLTHALVMTAYASFLKTGMATGVPRAALMLMPVVVSLVIALLTYRLIEHPANEWLKARWKQGLTVRPLPLPAGAVDGARRPGKIQAGNVR
jgi:exopolysaccharide production protein ExoZ